MSRCEWSSVLSADHLSALSALPTQPPTGSISPPTFPGNPQAHYIGFPSSVSFQAGVIRQVKETLVGHVGSTSKEVNRPGTTEPSIVAYPNTTHATCSWRHTVNRLQHVAWLKIVKRRQTTDRQL